MEIYGWDGHNYYHEDASVKNLVISGGRLVDHIDGFTNRCQNTGISIFPSSGSYSGSFTIHDVTIDTWAHAIAGGGLIEVYNCSLLIDAKNDLYTYPSGATCYSSIGPGGVGLWKPAAGTKVHDNVIVAGSENEGCSGGISISYGEGTAENPIEIYNNKVTLHRGPDDCYGGVTAKGYKQRWGNKHIHVYDNEFYVSAHSDSGSHALAWGHACEGIDICFTTSAYGEEGDYCDSFTVIENNHIEAVALNSGARGTGMRLSVRNELHDYDFVGAGNVFRHNYFGSSTSGVEFGKGDCGLCNSVVLIGDTIATIGTVDADYHTYESGDLSGPSVGNIVRDMVCLGEAADTNIYWDIYGEGSDLRYERTIELAIAGNNGLPVSGATVHIWPKQDYADSTNNNEAVTDKVTGSSGLVYDTLPYYWIEWEKASDSSYNPYRFRAVKDNDTVWGSLNLLDTSTVEGEYVIDTLTLGETQGEDFVLHRRIKGVKRP